MKDHRITARVTAKEQNRIASLAKQCGLSQTEYIRQRALGYAPKSAPPEPFFRFCEKADALLEQVPAPEVHKAALELFRETERLLLAPEKEVRPWQPPVSGPSTES